MWDEQIEAESEEIERKDEITAYSIRTQVQRRKVSIILKSTLAEKFDSADESFEMSPARSRNNFRAAEKRKISLHFFWTNLVVHLLKKSCVWKGKRTFFCG